MSQQGRWIWAILLCALIFAATPSVALPPNACAPLINPNHDWASEAYANVKMSDDRSACFLLPRNVIHKELREFNSQMSVQLDPMDLLSHLTGKTSIKVETEERKVDQALIDCLSAPTPEVIGISDGLPLFPRTLEAINATLREQNLSPLELVVSDVPGYRRCINVGPKFREEAYFPDAGPDVHLAFWCGNHMKPEMCIVEGAYDGMRAKIGYRKEAMVDVQPERAVNCVRAIGDLLRIDSDKS